MTRRPLIIAVLVTAVVLLGVAANGVPSTQPAGPSGSGQEGLVVSAGEDASGSTWFCPASMVGGGIEGSSNRVFVANPTPADLAATVTPWSAEGVAAAPVAIPIPASSTVAITPDQLGGATGSTQVELSPGGGVVSHRLVAADGLYAEGPCASRSATEADFPSLESRSGSSALLYVMNPFRSDVVVDVTVASDDGVRVPSELSSLVIPGGAVRSFELSQVVELREQFAATVRARSGRFVAEVVQVSSSAPAGLRLRLGAPAPLERIAFADGTVTAGLGDRYVVHNPGSEPGRVALSVIPYEADPAAWPEPFLLDIPPRRALVLDLAAEPRVPPDAPYWVRVDVLAGDGVVAERLFGVTGANSSGLERGLSSSTGVPQAASRWIVTGLDTAPTASAVAVVNPSLDSIAVVDVTSFVAGARAEVARLELPPGRGAYIGVDAIVATSPPDTLTGFVIDAERPVVVERRTVASTATDLELVPAFPVEGSLADLGSFADQLDEPGP